MVHFLYADLNVAFIFKLHLKLKLEVTSKIQFLCKQVINSFNFSAFAIKCVTLM